MRTKLPLSTAGKRKSRNVAQEDDDAPAALTKRKTSKLLKKLRLRTTKKLRRCCVNSVVSCVVWFKAVGFLSVQELESGR